MKTMVFGLAAVAAVLGGVALFAGSTLAYRGDAAVKGPLYSAERHEAMENAFESKDFDAWKNLMQKRGQARVTQVVNRDNFAKFAEAHELAEEGKTAEAQQLRQELGLGLRNGSGQGMGMGRGMHR
jgi:hypothetical protein